MNESDLCSPIKNACDKYLQDASWEPHLLRHVAGYVYCILQDMDAGHAVTDVSLNLGVRGLMAIVRCKAVGGPEISFVYDVMREEKGYEVSLAEKGCAK